MRAETVKYKMKSIIKQVGSYAVKIFKSRTAHSRNRCVQAEKRQVMKELKLKAFYLSCILLIVSSCNILGTGKNKLISESTNKNDSKKVILFIKYGNATTDNSFQILLTNYNHKLNNKDVGNIFTTDSDHGNTTIDSKSVTALWISNDSLIIKYDKRLRTFRKDTIYEGVKILYEEK